MPCIKWLCKVWFKDACCVNICVSESLRVRNDRSIPSLLIVILASFDGIVTGCDGGIGTCMTGPAGPIGPMGPILPLCPLCPLLPLRPSISKSLSSLSSSLPPEEEGEESPPPPPSPFLYEHFFHRLLVLFTNFRSCFQGQFCSIFLYNFYPLPSGGVRHSFCAI